MNTRHIFNDDFYKISAVLLSKKYLALENALRSKYGEVNLLIPTRGFTNESQYREWLKKAMDLPDKPGKFIEDLLSPFNLDVKNEFFRNCVAGRLFFNKMPWQDSIYPQSNITLTTRNSGKDRGLWVEIKPWTKKQDYVELWETIKVLQKSLLGYRTKEKLQITFERNFAVYQLYLEAKKDIETNGNPKKLSIINKMATLPDYDRVKKQFKDGDFSDNLRSITSDLNERLAEVNIL